NAQTMTPEPPRTGGAALRVYQNYRYTVVTIINGAQPHTQWWQRVNDPDRKWHHFRRHVAPTAVEAQRRVRGDFKEWIEGHREAADATWMDGLHAIPSRDAKIEPQTQERLINWGHAVCDAVMRTHMGTRKELRALPYAGGGGGKTR